MIANWGMAAFLGVMAAMNGWNCWLLLRDGEVRGLAPVTVLFRSCANVWQAWFFYALHQWAAFGAAVPATALNLAWVALAFYFRSENKLPRQTSRCVRAKLQAIRSC